MVNFSFAFKRKVPLRDFFLRLGKSPILRECERRMYMILKAARVNAGLSQSQVGKVLQVSKSTVSRWETGETPVDEKTKWKLSLLYQVDLEQLEFKNRKEK